MSDRVTVREAECLILGAGLAGLAAASVLGPAATVIERESRPGGLARTEHYEGYWFDRVLHLLYFPDEETRLATAEWMGGDLYPCRPVAWAHTAAGAAPYPVQMHLAALPEDVVVNCVRDLAAVRYGPPAPAPGNLAEALRNTFGPALCDLFLLPYNRKMWRRALEQLPPEALPWTVTAPDFEQVLRGALDRSRRYRSYNADGWYPQPPAGARLRGMEALAAALARHVADLRLGHEVTGIDLDRRTVFCRHAGAPVNWRYRRVLASTLPMPWLARLCRQTPSSLAEAVAGLSWNRVISVMFRVQGPRPGQRGHWEYYSDESLGFTRLVYTTAFDPLMAPPDGWGLMAEITEPCHAPMRPASTLLEECAAGAVRVGALPRDCRWLGGHVIAADPAYVVFTREREQTVQEFAGFLRAHGVEPLGRYGRWEYSSMGQVIRDGRAWAASVLPARADPLTGACPPRAAEG